MVKAASLSPPLGDLVILSFFNKALKPKWDAHRIVCGNVISLSVCCICGMGVMRAHTLPSLRSNTLYGASKKCNEEYILLLSLLKNNYYKSFTIELWLFIKVIIPKQQQHLVSGGMTQDNETICYCPGHLTHEVFGDIATRDACVWCHRHCELRCLGACRWC